MTSLDPEPALRRLRRLGRRLRRAVLARRRLLAAGCAAMAVVASLRALAPPPPALTPVTVAARDLAAGAVIAPGDLRTARLPEAAVPAAPVADPVGATLAAPLRRGEVVTDVRLVGQPSAQPPPGLVAAPVRLPDEAAAALLRPGDRVDLLATDARRGRSWGVAERALVLAVPPPDESGAGPLGGRVVVLAVPASSVEKVAAASVSEFLTWVYAD